MTVEEFDTEINEAVDSFIADLKVRQQWMEDRITIACERADEHKLPVHLCEASVKAAMVRMEYDLQ